jgi:hypothetical protein
VQKFFIITAFLLLTSVGVAAQTAAEQKPLSDAAQVEFAKRSEARSTTPVVSAKTSVERRQTTRIVDGRVLRVGPTTTYLKNGFRTDEVVRLLGKPTSITERQEGARLLATYTFERSEGRVLIAEFENGVLTGSRTETAEARELEARRDR